MLGCVCDDEGGTKLHTDSGRPRIRSHHVHVRNQAAPAAPLNANTHGRVCGKSVPGNDARWHAPTRLCVGRLTATTPPTGALGADDDCDADHNAAELEQVLLGRARGPHQDALVLGAGLLLELTGRVPGLSEGIAEAEKAITDGEAEKFLRQLRAFSESMS